MDVSFISHTFFSTWDFEYYMNLIYQPVASVNLACRRSGVRVSP